MAFAYKGFVPRFPLQSDEESHMSSWKVDDEEVKVGRQWWRALEVALSKERLEVEERVMGGVEGGVGSGRGHWKANRLGEGCVTAGDQGDRRQPWL